MVTDGGMETDLIFHHGVDLPLFAAFPLVDSPGGAVAADGVLRRVRGDRPAGRRRADAGVRHLARQP